MRNFFFVSTVIICCIILSACKSQINQYENPNNSAISEDVYISSTVSDSSERYDESYQSKESESYFGGSVFEETFLGSIDLNCDGISEDFFAANNYPYDEFRLVMYDDVAKTHIMDSTTIGRTDKIDIYRSPVKSDDPISTSSYNYYAVFISSGSKSLLLNRMYTGNSNNKCFSVFPYTQFLRSPLSCFDFNADMSKAEFDMLLDNTPLYLNKHRGLEYVKSICLSDFWQTNYSEEYIGHICIDDCEEAISLFKLNNDCFERQFKLCNSNYNYYAFDIGCGVDVYRRIRCLWDFSEESQNFFTYETDEYEYLLCFSNSDEFYFESIFLGTPSENYLASYDCYSANLDISALESEGWEYLRTLDIAV